MQNPNKQAIQVQAKTSLWIYGLIASYLLIAVATSFQLLWFNDQPWPFPLFKPVRFLFDGHDIHVYYQSSAWVAEGGTLYKDVFSEYPLAANIIFAIIRYISRYISLIWDGSGQKWVFSILWMASGLMLLLGCLKIAKEYFSPNYYLALLLPAVLYFSALRFDIYPAFALMLCFAAVKRERFLEAAFPLGIAISLKGYGLFIIPCMTVYILYKAGRTKALLFAILSITPYFIMSAVTLSFAGVDGLLSAYKFHAQRSFNGESMWDGLKLQLLVSIFPGLPMLMTIAFAVAGAAMKPKSYDRLIDASLVAVVGFTASTVFYSPQFCIWILCIAGFSSRQSILTITYILCLLTYFYYPIAWDSPFHRAASLKLSVLVTSVLRICLIIVACFPRRDSPRLECGSAL